MGWPVTVLSVDKSFSVWGAALAGATIRSAAHKIFLSIVFFLSSRHAIMAEPSLKRKEGQKKRGPKEKRESPPAFPLSLERLETAPGRRITAFSWDWLSSG
ncbi:hypothetical protein GCM10008941_00150 [Rhizomicrobium palustre]